MTATTPTPADLPAGRIPTVVIDADRRRALDGLRFWSSRDLLLVLAARDLKVRYRQTALGVIWVVLQPLLISGVFTFVFGRVAKLPSNGLPYFVFSYAGLMAWNVFSNVMQRCSGVLIQNTQLVTKIYFPRIIMPLATLLGSLVDFLVSAALMAVLLVSYRIGVTWRLAFVPLWLLLILTVAAAVGMAAGGTLVRYRDVQYLLPLLLQVLLYASPVAYATSAVPHKYTKVFELNPLAAPLDGFRWSLLNVGHPHRWAVLYSIAFALAALVIGIRVFARAERSFADVI